MRILYFSESFSIHDYNFLIKLSAYIGQVSFIRCFPSGIGENLFLLPVSVNVIKPLLNDSRHSSTILDNEQYLIKKINRIIRKIGIDIIISGPLHTCSYIISKTDYSNVNINVSWAFDLLYEAKINYIHRRNITESLLNADYTLCDSDCVAKLIKQINPESNILQFPWGLDFNLHDSIENQRIYTSDKDKYIILSNRNFENIYGTKTLLNTLKLLSKHKKSFHITLCGRGSLSQYVDNFINENNLNDFVTLLGTVTQKKMIELYNSSDIYISCSICDGTSVSLLEAMYYGLLITVTDIQGNKQWIKNQENGLLAQKENYIDFYECLIKLRKLSITEKNKMISNNFININKNADWHKNFLSLYNLFDKVQFK